MRASRIDFNAGADPVEDNKITDSGRVRRASWKTHRYVADGNRWVEVRYQLDPHEGPDVVALRLTNGQRLLPEGRARHGN